MKTETDTSTQTPEQVLNELRALVVEAEKILGQSTESNSGATFAALRERLEAAQERLATFYEDARRKVVDGAKYTDETIRDNPYTSMAVALGIGLLIGALAVRRSKSTR